MEIETPSLIKPMLAKVYSPEKHNIVGWWASEKLDGMRALWTGERLVTRTGKPIHAPSWFTERYPKNLPLDGELYIGRGMFQEIVSICRKKTPVDQEWMRVKYDVFDCFMDLPYEDRYYAFLDLDHIPTIRPLIHTNFDRLEDYLTYFDTVVSGGGEGIMLRNPSSLYEQKRSKNLLKLKPEDSLIATIIDYKPGKGRHDGRLGAYVCKYGEVVFDCGSGLSDRQRERVLPVATKIKVSHMGFTNAGVPRFPIFKGKSS